MDLHVEIPHWFVHSFPFLFFHSRRDYLGPFRDTHTGEREKSFMHNNHGHLELMVPRVDDDV